MLAMIKYVCYLENTYCIHETKAQSCTLCYSSVFGISNWKNSIINYILIIIEVIYLRYLS